jgi:hypothetical protein
MEIEMQTYFKLPRRLKMWIAGISISLVAASGIIAFARSIPDSYANIPDEGALSEQRAESSTSADVQTGDQRVQLALAPVSVSRRNLAACAECGVIESMRQIEHTGDLSRQDAVGVEVTQRVPGSASGSGVGASTRTGKGYEFTVRFRDGRTTVFRASSQRAWQLGSRVIVIGPVASTN